MKKQIEKTLNSLAQILKDQKAPHEIHEALEKIQSFMASEIEWPDEGHTLESSDSYPLPPELRGKDRAYAVFSDGACRGNPGPGAWGCMAQDREGRILFEASGVEHRSTNNKMEIQGAIEGFKKLLEYYQENDISLESAVYFYCDSRYVVDGLKSWIPGWKRRGWRKADKKPPENLELWQQLDKLAQKFPQLTYLWVKAHAGHPQNERCDQLANRALDELGY